jgi:hypothetical protein
MIEEPARSPPGPPGRVTACQRSTGADDADGAVEIDRLVGSGQCYWEMDL